MKELNKYEDFVLIAETTQERCIDVEMKVTDHNFSPVISSYILVRKSLQLRWKKLFFNSHSFFSDPTMLEVITLKP